MTPGPYVGGEAPIEITQRMHDTDNVDEQFISEPIVPAAGEFDPRQMAIGLASMPTSFRWRDRQYVIVECLEHRKVSQPEVTGERYLRRQEFRVQLDTGQIAWIYVLRNAPAGASRKRAKQRWFLYTITPESTPGSN